VLRAVTAGARMRGIGSENRRNTSLNQSHDPKNPSARDGVESAISARSVECRRRRVRPGGIVYCSLRNQ
jgi:hypothetical protein